MAYLDLTAELAGTIPGLSQVLAGTYIRRAWRAIRDERPWSFLTATGTIFCPVQITAGTVAVTQGSTTATFDTAATAALVPLVTSTITPLTQLQFRVNGQSLYQIAAVVATAPNLVITLDNPFRETTGTGQVYQVYRAYVQAPFADFLNWSSLNDFQNGYAITKDRFGYLRETFDRRDPQRQSQGLAYYLGAYQSVTGGQTLWELWPHPTQGQTFVTEIRRFGTEFALPTDSQPEVIPDTLLLERVYGWHAYPWAAANQARFPALKGVDYVGLATESKKAYGRDLLLAERNDNEIALKSVYNRGRLGSGGRPLAGPADAKYWQSHPISW